MPAACAHLRLLLEAIADVANADDVAWVGRAMFTLGT
jgi:hypothetical protein